MSVQLRGSTNNEKSFSERWTRDLSRCQWWERDEFIVRVSRGRSVLHVGATDSPFTENRVRAGALLHLNLRDVAERLTGIDCDATAVEFLRRDYGVDDIVVADACKPIQSAVQGPFDVILCCDVIEHVDNPGGLLRSLRAVMTKNTLLVITTINSLSVKLPMRVILRDSEDVHPDHVCYYSFATLASLLSRHDLIVESYGAFQYPTVYRLTRGMLSLIYRVRPSLGDGLIVTARLLE